MSLFEIAQRFGMACPLLLAPLSIPARASSLTLPPETLVILDKIYSLDLQGAIEAAQHMEQERPNQFATWPDTNYFVVTWKKQK